MLNGKVARFVLAATLGGLIASGPISCISRRCPPRYDGQGDPCGLGRYLLVEIGEFRSRDEGVRAAIKRLAADTQCPETGCIRIMWSGPAHDTSNTSAFSQALVYVQNGAAGTARLLGYEHDFLSGAGSRLYLVDRAAIQAVAEKGGTLEDFDQYDQEPLCGYERDRLVQIGQFHTRDEGIRAAIKSLDAEIQRAPERCIRVVWAAPADDAPKTAASAQALVCEDNWGDGQIMWLGYERGSHSGAGGRHYLVDRASIDAVANKGGSLEDFDQYDQRPSLTRSNSG
jgi:Arc/MetJ-type ribon-helix-helix transcriptional regulator